MYLLYAHKYIVPICPSSYSIIICVVFHMYLLYAHKYIVPICPASYSIINPQRACAQRGLL